jgi:hypothetical protein
MLPDPENLMKTQSGNDLRGISSSSFHPILASASTYPPFSTNALIPSAASLVIIMGHGTITSLYCVQFLFLKMLTVNEINRHILIGKCPEIADQ